MMQSSVDILIVGGGVVGLTTAWELARTGVKVTVLDRGDLGRGASWAGAGIVPPANPEAARTPFDRLRAFSVGRMEPLSHQLRELTGIDNGYRRCGALDLTGDGEHAEEWRGPGIRQERLDAAGLRRIEPGLESLWRTGYHLPDLAQVRNPWHLRALIAACERAGVRLLPGVECRGWIRRGDRIEGARTSAGDLPAGRVLLASGAWSTGLLESVGCRLGVKPIRGQIALLHTQEPGLRPCLLVGPRYLVPREDGRLLVGSCEEDAGFEIRTTTAVIADLLAFAMSLLPRLGLAEVERCWAGLRPGSIDGLPYLGDVPGTRGLYVAAGHFRSGILLSPGTAVLMSQQLTDQPPSLPLEAFAVHRNVAVP